MEYKELVGLVSEARLKRYFIATGDFGNAVDMYKANILVAQSFHPLLGIFEVILRNQIDRTLTNHFNDVDWILNQRAGFMIDSTLTYYDVKSRKNRKDEYIIREVNKAKNKLERLQVSVTSGGIIAEQMFGFWTELFENNYYKALKGRPIQIFRKLPPGVGRKEISDNLNKIRLFRNRINHNEPICFLSDKVDFSTAEEVYSRLTNLLSWIDPQILHWSADVDSVIENINKAKLI